MSSGIIISALINIDTLSSCYFEFENNNATFMIKYASRESTTETKF